MVKHYGICGNDGVFTDLDWLVSITVKGENLVVFLEISTERTSGRVENSDNWVEMALNACFPSKDGNFSLIEWHHKSLRAAWYDSPRCHNELPVHLGNESSRVVHYTDKVLAVFFYCSGRCAAHQTEEVDFVTKRAGTVCTSFNSSYSGLPSVFSKRVSTDMVRTKCALRLRSEQKDELILEVS